MSRLIPYQCSGCGSTLISAMHPLYVAELKKRGMGAEDMYFNQHMPPSTKRKDVLDEMQAKPCCRLHLLTHPTGLQSAEYVKESK
jgi:DNA-directed RNA polymerase subunit N (RpoN/RPB10)